MGSSRRSWFPLAALGFALLVLVAAELLPEDAPIEGGFVTHLGTGGLGGTGLAVEQLSVTATAVGVVPSARLGWLAGLACVVLAVAGWYWVSLRRAGTPPRPVRFVLGTLGALAAVPLLDLVGALELRLPGDVRGALLAALGLLVLAAYERSWFLVAVTAVFALVTVVFPTPLAGALVAAALLFAAAFVVLLRGPVTAADTA
ncbi:hypothetical protein SAMN05421837_106204 [Amycolatopsis pretoriensis]|uniref:Uncharacterized protein n=1 Tax=Amycolatopsis pretoriensis TaxID=218821 RepID=A0A1H5R4A2_9PSEU|nr:hypothetical protein [Amycolatopsis pretoriensis]SEF32388.1 hypothetical protein SAMN05421837_106204 [Amycolatopsis pretoriensis]